MADDVKAILDAEDRRYQAMIDGDLETLRELLAEEVSYTHGTGVRDTKEEFLGKVNSYYVYHSIDHPVERVDVLGDTAAVVHRMTADLDVDGVRKTIDNLGLAVWTRASGDWKLLAYASTPIPAG